MFHPWVLFMLIFFYLFAFSPQSFSDEHPFCNTGNTPGWITIWLRPATTLVSVATPVKLSRTIYNRNLELIKIQSFVFLTLLRYCRSTAFLFLLKIKSMC